ncbi:MAG: LuxR C-terminal-related transcriptional regulator [Bacteroidales bacterium]|nr:LuxR C-terminal-related transcriptional regulator [Bacteroidales bacterium]
MKAVLSEYVPASGIELYDNLLSYQENQNFYDLIFVDTLIYLSNSEIHKDKKRIILLSSTSACHFEHPELILLDLSMNRQVIQERLETILSQSQTFEQEGESKELSEREREVLELVAKGYISKEIASMLNISHYTVQAHRKKISAKLGIKSVSALAIYAMMHGIVSIK